MSSCHTKGCDSLPLSKGRYDETFAGEDDVCMKISEYPPPPPRDSIYVIKCHIFLVFFVSVFFVFFVLLFQNSNSHSLALWGNDCMRSCQ